MKQYPTQRSNYSKNSDAQLLAQVKAGDKWAFVEIVSRYQATVSGVALSILRDFSASEDTAQETFLCAWQKINQLRQGDKLRPWLCSIARTTALTSLRKRKRECSLDTPLEESIDLIRQPDQIAVEEEERSLVFAAIDKLPERYRLPLVLFYREGKSVRAVAEALEISEDTTRKRLSRARTMLRDRISGLVETVLTHRLPSATFTMAVATSIGAMSPPAAVAGSIFTTSLKSTTSTSGSLTGILTTMTSTTKSALASVATIIISLTAGYHSTAALKTKQHSSSHAIIPAEIPPDEIEEALPQITKVLKNSALIQEWKELQKKLGTGPEALPLIHDAISNISDPFRKQGLFIILASEWAKISPESGLDFYAKLSHWEITSQAEFFAREWVRQAGWTAIDTLKEQIPSVTWKHDFRKWAPGILKALSPVIHHRPTEELADLIDLFPKQKPYQWGYEPRREIGDALALLAKQDLEHALTTAKMLSPKHHLEAFVGIAKAWASQDGDAAFAWAQSQLKGEEREEVMRHTLAGWAQKNPTAALDLLGQLPPGKGFRTTEELVLEAAANADLVQTLAWIKDHPKSFGFDTLQSLSKPLRTHLLKDPHSFLSEIKEKGILDAVLDGIGSAMMGSGVTGQPIWQWLDTQDSSPTILKLKKKVMNGASSSDPETAITILNDMPLSERNAFLKIGPHPANHPKIINESLVWLLAPQIQQLDHFLSLATPEVEQNLLTFSFRYLGERSLHDPQIWIDRISRINAKDRPQAVASLSKAWAKRDPASTLLWLNQLPTSEQRYQGTKSAVSGWMSKEPTEALAWVESLPSGNIRDSAFAAVVQNSTNPQEVSKWLERIESSTNRINAAVDHLVLPHPRDQLKPPHLEDLKKSVQDFLSQSTFSTEEQAEITRQIDAIYQ